jgi:hypothetical protein
VKKSRENIKSTTITELEKIHELIRGKIPRDIDYKKEIEAAKMEKFSELILR